MEASRQIFWNTDGKTAMYVLALLATLAFAVGVLNKIKIWLRGEPLEAALLNLKLKEQFLVLVRHQEQVFKSTVRRFMHLGIFYGFLLLLIGTTLIALQEHFGLPTFKGSIYLIMSLLMDLGGLAALVGVIIAAYKRYLSKSDHEEYTLDNALLLLLLFLILFSGFLLEGLRIAAAGDMHALWSPVGWLLAGLIQGVGIPTEAALRLHEVIWYLHMVLSLGFIAYIPYSRLFHMLATPLNVLLKPTSPIGDLTPIEVKAGESLGDQGGVVLLQDFKRKQLLELDACISCLRCEKGCPAQISGAPLSPRRLVQGLKDHAGRAEAHEIPLVGQGIQRETLLSCTTCGLCEVKCPAQIEHVKRIVDLRRGLTKGGFGYPPEIEEVFSNILQQGNPWGLASRERNPALQNPGRILREGQETDVLFWVGCQNTFTPQSQSIASAMMKIFEKAGVDYGYLGVEEGCCGDSVRRLGNETLFRELVHRNSETLKKHRFRRIVTTCPHCYQLLKNEYPQWGADYPVFHHSEFMVELLQAGALKPGKVSPRKITYHDPCYLGRYNTQYEAPRQVITAIPGVEFQEMKNNRQYAFCCGGGGGHAWVKQEVREDISQILLDKALKPKAEVLATACSLCQGRLNEAVLSRKAPLQIRDIAEIMAEALD